MSNENSNESKSSRPYETEDVYSIPYELAKNTYLAALSDESLPENKRVSKDVAKHLTLSVANVQIEPFVIDGAVHIRLKIIGDRKYIIEVDRALEARYSGNDE